MSLSRTSAEGSEPVQYPSKGKRPGGQKTAALIRRDQHARERGQYAMTDAISSVTSTIATFLAYPQFSGATNYSFQLANVA
jgi:hypothetical protein